MEKLRGFLGNSTAAESTQGAQSALWARRSNPYRGTAEFEDSAFLLFTVFCLLSTPPTHVVYSAFNFTYS